MEAILTYFIQVNVLLLVIYLGYRFLLNGLTFYGLNRYYFIGGGLFALLYPFLNVAAWLKTPIEPVGELVAYLPGMLQEQETSVINISLLNMVLAILMLGALFFILKFAIQLISLLRIHRHSKPASWQNYIYRNVWLPIVPFSFFNKVYINRAQHQELELHDIFAHEYTHVKGFHSLDILLYEFLLTLCWYNPCVWLMRRFMRQNLEFLTDQAVLNKGVDKQSYQYSLLHVTKQGQQVGISNQFNFKMLKKRISMMNKKRSSALELGKYICLLPLIIFAAAAFTVTKVDAKIAEVVHFTERTQIAEIVPKVETAIDTVKSEAEKQIPTTKTHASKDTLFSKVTISPITTDDGMGASSKVEQSVNMFTGMLNRNKIPLGKEPLLFVDGQRISSKEKLNAINLNDIESINVIKGSKLAVDKYGEDAENGVIEISLKKKNNEVDKQEPLAPKNDKKGITIIPAGRFEAWDSSDAAKEIVVVKGAGKDSSKVVSYRFIDNDGKGSERLISGKQITFQARSLVDSATAEKDTKVIIRAVSRKQP